MIDKLIEGAAKKKGRDGKACWKGYTLRGTKYTLFARGEQDRCGGRETRQFFCVATVG